MRSIPPILLSKIKEQNQTIWNNSQPKMEVSVARAKSTVMDSTYWTVETIRQTSGLGDVSVAPRRFKAYGRPNRIYEIHVKDGEVITSIREYPDKLREGFKNQFSLGLGSSVAVAFNGEWKRYRKLWRLITEEKPWIIWVDDTGILWRQHWDNDTTKMQLDTDVVRVRAIRAWKNVNRPDQDQGIVVGYIKTDGAVYYRNYCQQADNSYVWESAKQLIQFTGAAAVSLNLFITNDYRMGFIIEDNLGQINWLITPRNWAGMAIGAEFIQARVEAKIDFAEIEKLKSYGDIEYINANINGEVVMLWGSAINNFVKCENFGIALLNENNEEYQNYGYRLLAKTEHDLIEIDKADFSLIDENLTIFAITEIEKVSTKNFIIKTFDMNNATGVLTLLFKGSGNTKGVSGQNIDSFSITFIPTNLVPTSDGIPRGKEYINTAISAMVSFAKLSKIPINEKEYIKAIVGGEIQFINNDDINP